MSFIIIGRWESIKIKAKFFKIRLCFVDIKIKHQSRPCTKTPQSPKIGNVGTYRDKHIVLYIKIKRNLFDNYLPVPKDHISAV